MQILHKGDTIIIGLDPEASHLRQEIADIIESVLPEVKVVVTPHLRGLFGYCPHVSPSEKLWG